MPIDATIAGIEVIEANIGSRGGFDTIIAATGGFKESNSFPDGTITAAPTVNLYGFWGEHGFAAVQIVDGPFSGEDQGISFALATSLPRHGLCRGRRRRNEPRRRRHGDLDRHSPKRPPPASTRTFEWRPGTATITIADLSHPRVSVGIDVPGYAIDAPAWADILLVEGRFASGTAGSDYLEGNFHGPDHGETYGVFDTGAYIGAFGAIRDQ